MMSEDRQLVDIETIAKMLGVHPETIRRASRKGTIRSYKLGGVKSTVRYDPAEVKEDLRQETYRRKHGEHKGG